MERSFCNAADSDILSANSLTTSSELSHYAATAFDKREAQTECYNSDANGKSILDYKNASKKFFTSIKANIASTFDYHQTKESSIDKTKYEKNRGSMEFKPIFIENMVSLCNLRHLSSATNEDVCKIALLLDFILINAIYGNNFLFDLIQTVLQRLCAEAIVSNKTT